MRTVNPFFLVLVALVPLSMACSSSTATGRLSNNGSGGDEGPTSGGGTPGIAATSASGAGCMGDDAIFVSAVTAMETLAQSMSAEVTTACQNIALAGAADPTTWAGKTGDDLTNAACEAASAAIDATFAGSVTLTTTVVPGQCSASISADSVCNAGCLGAASCAPAQLEGQCSGGQLSGGCSGLCMGTCQLPAGSMCNGTCSGTCNGMCDGEAGMGSCAGTCTGTCSGSCNANVTGSCSGTCTGSCSVAFSAPSCDGKFGPPTCLIDANCAADCNAEVQASASCTPPSVTIAVNGAATAQVTALVTALETNLPVLVQDGLERAVDLTSDLAALTSSEESLGADAGCAAGQESILAAAAASIDVCVSASASVSGKGGAQ